MIERAAPSAASVFITGETGTGKELCAEVIQSLSPRSQARLVVINCAAIPHDLLQSEIFGHVRGAFTDAVSNRTGAANLADGGTLFLDEICDMAPGLQAKLLRFLKAACSSRLEAASPRRSISDLFARRIVIRSQKLLPGVFVPISITGCTSFPYTCRI